MELILENIKGMSCNHCKMAVENAVKDLPGVSFAEVDLGKGSILVEHEGVSVDSIKNAILDAGYEV